ncbi:hypothetical protein PI125_g8134 [Phytophthora idaei]|nr:hypothetical protein PI125_g8134 [Phytophthora idaei]KAG3158252.1 hypothetical protein PI126_g7933 [Phytophthora idaei]
MGIATVVTAADAQQGKENTGVTFAETIEHLGRLPVLGGAVLLLALAYIALVEWLMPRGRRLHQFKGTRRQIKTARKRE